MIGHFLEHSSPGRTTPGRVPLLVFSHVEEPLRSAVFAQSQPQKKKKERKKPKSKNKKVKSISDSIFSEWLIQMEREAELTTRGSGVDDFSHKESLTERVGKIEVQR